MVSFRVSGAGRLRKKVDKGGGEKSDLPKFETPFVEGWWTYRINHEHNLHHWCAKITQAHIDVYANVLWCYMCLQIYIYRCIQYTHTDPYFHIKMPTNLFVELPSAQVFPRIPRSSTLMKWFVSVWQQAGALSHLLAAARVLPVVPISLWLIFFWHVYWVGTLSTHSRLSFEIAVVWMNMNILNVELYLVHEWFKMVLKLRSVLNHVEVLLDLLRVLERPPN